MRAKKRFDWSEEKPIKVDETFTIRIRRAVSRATGNISFAWYVYKDVKETPADIPWSDDPIISYGESEQTYEDAEKYALKALEGWKRDVNFKV